MVGRSSNTIMTLLPVKMKANRLSMSASDNTKRPQVIILDMEIYGGRPFEPQPVCLSFPKSSADSKSAPDARRDMALY